VDINSLKDIKSRSFAHKFNTTNYEIAQSNLKFLVKLEKVKPFTSHAAADRLPPSFPSAVAKRRIIETERENSRIFVKMKSVSSNLSRDRMGS
jgi:type IV secretory pathway VirB4 component